MGRREQPSTDQQPMVKKVKMETAAPHPEDDQAPADAYFHFGYDSVPH